MSYVGLYTSNDQDKGGRGMETKKKKESKKRAKLRVGVNPSGWRDRTASNESAWVSRKGKKKKISQH